MYCHTHTHSHTHTHAHIHTHTHTHALTHTHTYTHTQTHTADARYGYHPSVSLRFIPLSSFGSASLGEADGGDRFRDASDWRSQDVHAHPDSIKSVENIRLTGCRCQHSHTPFLVTCLGMHVLIDYGMTGKRIGYICSQHTTI